MGQIPDKKIRLVGKPTGYFEKISGFPGDLYYDYDIKSLRLFPGGLLGGKIIADREWVESRISGIDGSGGSTTVSWADITNKPNFALVSTTGDYNSLINRPTLFSGSYNDLTDKPTISGGSSFSGSYIDLTDKPTIPTDLNQLTDTDSLLFSRSYNDLSDLPTIPTNNNELTNGAGYITASALSGYATESFVATALKTEEIGLISTVGFVENFNVNNYNLWFIDVLEQNFTANFTNLSLTNGVVTNAVMILNQGATPYIPETVTISGGSGESVAWTNGTPPTGNANQFDVVTFTFIRLNDAWTIIGNLSSYSY